MILFIQDGVVVAHYEDHYAPEVGAHGTAERVWVPDDTELPMAPINPDIPNSPLHPIDPRPSMGTAGDNATILAQIMDLEKLETPRRVAEAVLGTEQQINGVGWLKNNRNKITALRTQLKK